MNEDVRQYILAWVQKAENDLKTVEIILDSSEENKPYDTACFHCQQAVEKYLKAYLVFLDKDFPRTHNIAGLIEIGSETDKELHNFLSADALTIYATEIRYPDDIYLPSQEETVNAFESARKIKEFVLKRLKSGEQD